MKEQLNNFGIGEYMDLITFVTDRGSNFKKAFSDHKVLYCVAHRLNNVLKRCFYHIENSTKGNDSPMQKIRWMSKVIGNEITPTKLKMTTQTKSTSPEYGEEQLSDEEHPSSDES